MTNKLLPRFIALIGIPVFLTMIYIAGSWGLADVYYRPAMNELKNWRLGKITLEDKDWDELQVNLSKALALDPDNPEIHESLGLAIEGRFFGIVSRDGEAQPYRQLALEHYKKSILLRPVWPYAWAALSSVKYRLGQIDDEFFQALHNVAKLGPWEPGLQRLVVEMGMNEWKAFPFKEREFILEVVTRALQKQPHKILPLIKSKGFLDLICLLYKDKQSVINYCEKYKTVKSK